MKQWAIAAAIAFVFVSCDNGNKIYSGPADNSSSSLNNKISVAEMVTVSVNRSLPAGIGAKENNEDLFAATDNHEMLNKCNGLLKTAIRHF